MCKIKPATRMFVTTKNRDGVITLTKEESIMAWNKRVDLPHKHSVEKKDG